MRIKGIMSIFLVLSTFTASAQDTVNCINCNGAGSFQCRTCGGGGSVLWPGLYGLQWVRCGVCNGTGTSICPLCGGGGKVTFNTSNYSNYSSGSGNYNNASSSSSNNSNSSSQTSIQRRKCSFCNNGREMIERSINVYTNGIKVNQKSCSECGRTYDANQWAHFHQQCSHCRGKGYIE